ncbi:MAG: tRNA pseudouridine(38-40) synthase TruA [Caulobacterales bacterium]|nr:tRNA pseudouridine(38-40) synthase TruA [Caulobacterales bacterium]MCA0371529.1 tRNA pseudouridine(38-40) synthase TruA [Pseudomonadota bacterium]
MTNWKLTLEYDGTAFCGWQSQPEKCGVQDAVESAIEKIDGGFKRVSVAGRTDAGVHALGQVCSVKLEKDWQDFRLIEALNAHLRKLGKVAILDAQIVDDDFDARFSATSRHYLYIIQNRRAPATHLKNLVWQTPFRIDIDLMKQGSQKLIGKHDFTTFRDLQCQAKSPIKTLDKFDIDLVQTSYGEQIHCTLSAQSFLHRQVRSMVGTLVDVGRGRFSVSELVERLEARDRKMCGEVAPSDGLYLTKVGY